MQKNLTLEVFKNFLIYLDFQGNPEFCPADIYALCLPLYMIIFNQMQSSLLTSCNALVPGVPGCSCSAQ